MKVRNFALGRILATRGILEEVPNHRILQCLSLHASCDWGICCNEDRNANNRALIDGSRIFSVYLIDDDCPGKGKFYIITEATIDDNGMRESTCCLLPEEY